MPRFLKIFRSQKRRSMSSSTSPVKKKRNNDIFRSSFGKNSTNKKMAPSYPVIEAAMTYSLSEDEESCHTLTSPKIESEYKLSSDELEGEKIIENVSSFPQKGTDTSARNETVENKQEAGESEKTMTFSHIEIMRNELAHLMQIAEKDKEISGLKQAAADMKVEHIEVLKSKDIKITSIYNVVAELELALSAKGEKLALVEKAHSQAIEALMKTQYDYHELKTNSWFTPLLC